jgi:hypothetical protein
MKTSLANAFAPVRLATVQEFHLSRRNTNAPDRLSSSLSRNIRTTGDTPRERGGPWRKAGSSSIIPCFLIRATIARLEHSHFFKVTANPARADPHEIRKVGPVSSRPRMRAHRRSPRRNALHRHPTTSFLTATTLVYAAGAGITAAAGTRLALQ